MRIKSMQKQNGAALFVGLVILAIITLMGYTSMKGTILQEKMAAGLHNQSLAHSGANTAVRAGEEFIYRLITQTNGVNVEGTPGGQFNNLYSLLADPLNPPDSPLNPISEEFKKSNWDSSYGTEHAFNFNAVTANAALNTNPQYIIEEIYSIPLEGFNSQEFGMGGSDTSIQKGFYITGKSDSGDGKTMSLVQSVFTAVVSSDATN